MAFLDAVQVARWRYVPRCFAVCVALLLSIAIEPAHAETKSWIFADFYPAMYTQPDNCPDGVNPFAHERFARALKLAGKTDAEIEKFLDQLYKSSGGGSDTNFALAPEIKMRGSFQGRPVDAYVNPALVEDPGFKVATGRYAYGFNLDGKGADSPDSFEDPQTHDRGVDNQLFRLWGCTPNHQAKLPEQKPNFPSEQWEIALDEMPAWLLSVTGNNLSVDGDVTVTVDRALSSISRDAQGRPRAYMTYEVDPDPSTHNVFPGKIVGGRLIAEAPELLIRGQPLHQRPRRTFLEYRFKDMHLRLDLKPDAGAEGFIGGYLPWMQQYFLHASNEFITETLRGLDVVGMYYALQRLADAYPDPLTKKNTHISTAWWINLVPAMTTVRSVDAETLAQKKRR